LRSPLSPREREIIEACGAHREDSGPLRGERVAEGRGGGPHVLLVVGVRGLLFFPPL